MSEQFERRFEFELPCIDSGTVLIHAIVTETDDPKIGFEEMSVAEYAERFDAPVMPNGWPDGMSLLDMSLSLGEISAEHHAAFIDAVFGGDES